MTHERPPPARPWHTLINRQLALRGWTKTELSERSGVARTTIDNWATNSRRPSAKAVNAVADALGIDRAQAHILAGIIAPDAGQPEPETGIPPEVAEWIDAKIPPDRRPELLRALRAALADDEASASGQSGEGRRAG